MNQRVTVSVSALVLVAVVGGGAALAVRSGSSSHTPKTITVQGTNGGVATTRAATDAMAPNVGPNPGLTFVLSGDLPALDGERHAWHLAANPTADPAAIAALAKALGVEGDVKAADGGWQVGRSEMGYGLFVYNSPGLPWSYTNFDIAAFTCGAGGSATPEGGSSTTIPPSVCTAPPTPTGVPTTDEAVAKTNDLLKALGIDPSGFAITANVSEWSADVQLLRSLGGVAAPSRSIFFSFGGEGRLTQANGYLLEPEKADSYPLIGTSKAFELLKSGNGYSGYFTPLGYATDSKTAVVTTVPASESTYVTVTGTNCMGYDPAAPPPPLPVCMCVDAIPAPGAATTVPCPVTPCVPPSTTTVAVGQTMSPDAITCEQLAPMPIEPTTPPEPVSITITGVHETLLPFTGSDGSEWLVPGYEFTSADGGTWPVLAIDQSFLDQVAPSQPNPETPVSTAVSGPALETPTVTAPPETAAGG